MSTRRKRICIVMGGHFSATIGGAQYQAKCVVEGLKEDGGFEIFYLARAINPDYVPEGYAIHRIAEPTGLRKFGFAFDTPNLLRLLNKIKPDIVYQRGLKAYTGVVAYYAKRAGCQSMFHIAHDYNLLPLDYKGHSRIQWLKRLEKRMGEYGIRNVDHVIAQTQFQAELLKENYGREASAVVPNFHPVPEQDLEKPSQPIRVIWVANFKPVKQPEVFVRLAEELSDRKDIHFVMIGRAGEEGKYSELHAQIERMSNLTYLGEVPIEEVNRQLANCHIFVNTSRAEGFPNTFIQAWMRKVPAVSLDVNPDDVLSSETVGFWGKTYENMRDRVVQLADDPLLRERMGLAAQQHALEVHSPKAVRKLVAIMNQAGLRND